MRYTEFYRLGRRTRHRFSGFIKISKWMFVYRQYDFLSGALRVKMLLVDIGSGNLYIKVMSF